MKRLSRILLVSLLTMGFCIGGASFSQAIGEGEIQPRDYANEHCPECGFSTSIRRYCHDGGRLNEQGDYCSVHLGSGCKVKKFWLGCKRVCQNNNSHVRYTTGDHMAQHYHTVTSEVKTYYCPYEANHVTLYWN